MKISKQQIEEIADNLDRGMRCFYNLKTGEIKTLLNLETWIDVDEEVWQEDSKEIDENRDDYFEFKGFNAYEFFQIMADFAESIDDIVMHNKLIDGLNRTKSFQRFKREIYNSNYYRRQWIDFKIMCYIQEVEKQIDIYNNDSNK
jgi:hypothetical protein